MKALVTGVAGFIGSHLSKKLLDLGYAVEGIDNLNDYYDVQIKKDRLSFLEKYKTFTFHLADLYELNSINEIFDNGKFDCVINLAAQAGVRYSIENPDVYIRSNIVGFFNILECCRKYNIHHLIFASSSSVYGMNSKVPYSTNDRTDKPVSLYAATKKSNEIMAYSYSKLYDIPCTGLRFFTVYGPMGRPDMAYFSFTNKAVNGETINLYNDGKLQRDFTYIDDIVEGIKKIINHPPLEDSDGVRYKIYNIGNNHPVQLTDFVSVLEKQLIAEKIIDKPFKKKYLPMQPGDVYTTYADVDDLFDDLGWKPSTSLDYGILQFAKWYKKYYKLDFSKEREKINQ